MSTQMIGSGVGTGLVLDLSYDLRNQLSIIDIYISDNITLRHNKCYICCPD